MDDPPVAFPVNKDYNHLISVQIQRRLALAGWLRDLQAGCLRLRDRLIVVMQQVTFFLNKVPLINNCYFSLLGSQDCL